MTGVNTWDTNAANNIQANIGYTWDEGMSPGAVNNSARAVLADVRSMANDLIWFQYGKGAGPYTPVYVASTQYKIAGVDVSTVYHVGRRTKVTGSSTGTIYGTITAVAFSTDTTVTVSWDSGSLSNEAFTAVYISQVPATGFPVQGLKVTAGKTLTASNSLTLAGTDGTTMTFPSTSATVASTDAANTFTGTQTFSNAISYGGVTLSSAVTGTGNMVLSASPTLTGTAIVNQAKFGGSSRTDGAVNAGSVSASANAVSADAGGGFATYYGNVNSTSSNFLYCAFNSVNIGAVACNGSSNVQYLTSSDERLKNFNVPQRDHDAIIDALLIEDAEYTTDPGDYLLSISAQQCASTGYTEAVVYPQNKPIYDYVDEPVFDGETPVIDTETGKQVTKQIVRKDEGGAPIVLRMETDEEAQHRIWMAEYGRLGILALKGVQNLRKREKEKDEVISDLSRRLAALEAR